MDDTSANAQKDGQGKEIHCIGIFRSLSAFKIKQLQCSKSCIKDSFLQGINVLDNWVPKHITTIDEKCLRRLAPRSASMYLDWGNMGFFSDGRNTAKTGSENRHGLARFDFDCPLAGTGSVVISPAEQWIVGSIMGSNSMVNILKSPLLRRNGSYDGDATFENVNFTQRLVSMSSSNSTCSDQSSSSPSAAVTQGTLQCTWNGGNPHFVFSIDNQKLVYVAKLYSVDSADDKALESVYLFHSRKGAQKEHMIHDKESHLVGKLKVSTSFALCPKNSRIMQREFVLFGNENYTGELRMAEVFRTSNSLKRRTNSIFGGSSAILENSSWEPSQERDNNIDALDHLPEKSQEKVGGWGLNFLKKVAVMQAEDVKSAVLSACCAQGSAGLHGGPRTRNGGPSSLVDRWRSGGQCDCGGWDLGCPLTFSSPADTHQECKLVDMFIEGSETVAPPMRMVNVRDGLYFVSFQSTLSALQSFSIAVAFIHSQKVPVSNQNMYRS
ncbi:Cadherin EGF LAG seven-pass G-type receptor [Salix suchowensis]|nr:Cadherin EGF LAG seven-pass G-type receptor [Salix suchowensis]